VLCNLEVESVDLTLPRTPLRVHFVDRHFAVKNDVEFVAFVTFFKHGMSLLSSIIDGEANDFQQSCIVYLPLEEEVDIFEQWKQGEGVGFISQLHGLCQYS